MPLIQLMKTNHLSKNASMLMPKANRDQNYKNHLNTYYLKQKLTSEELHKKYLI